MADDHSSRLLENLSSCPEALQELSKALMPSLINSLTALVQKWQELDSDEASNGEGDNNEEEGNNGNGANNGNEVNTGNGVNYSSRANDSAWPFHVVMKPITVSTITETCTMVEAFTVMEAAIMATFRVRCQPRLGCPRSVTHTLGAGLALHHRHQVGCQASPKSKGSLYSLHPKPLKLHVSDPRSY